MIPYDDLVAALQAWRARQGLPVAEGAALPPRIAAAAPPPPPRTNPPAAPPARKPTPMPMPLAAPDETHDEAAEAEIEEHAMIEESHYENEGDDFALSFAADGHNGHVSGIEEVAADGSETMVGHEPPPEPERPSDLTDPGAAHRNGREDW
jgi:hypothetical protein